MLVVGSRYSDGRRWKPTGWQRYDVMELSRTGGVGSKNSVFGDLRVQSGYTHVGESRLVTCKEGIIGATSSGGGDKLITGGSCRWRAVWVASVTRWTLCRSLMDQLPVPMTVAPWWWTMLLLCLVCLYRCRWYTRGL